MGGDSLDGGAGNDVLIDRTPWVIDVLIGGEDNDLLDAFTDVDHPLQDTLAGGNGLDSYFQDDWDDDDFDWQSDLSQNIQSSGIDPLGW